MNNTTGGNVNEAEAYEAAFKKLDEALAEITAGAHEIAALATGTAETKEADET